MIPLTLLTPLKRVLELSVKMMLQDLHDVGEALGRPLGAYLTPALILRTGMALRFGTEREGLHSVVLLDVCFIIV
jgi:hypothetical protein